MLYQYCTSSFFCLGGVWISVCFAFYFFFFLSSLFLFLFLYFFPLWYLHGIIGETRYRILVITVCILFTFFGCSIGETARFRVVSEVMWYVMYLVCPDRLGVKKG